MNPLRILPPAAAALVLAAVCAAAPAPSTLPDVPHHVLDQTGTLDAAQVAALERKLARHESGGGAQIAVVIVKTTGAATIEQYAVSLFEKNAFGRKGADDGVLLLVAKDDRNARIEVGYGLEGTIPDIRANQVLDEHVVPAFRAGDFHGGIERATDGLMALSDGDPIAAGTGAAPAAATSRMPQPVPTSPTFGDLPPPGVYVHNPAHWLMTQDVEALTAKLQAFENRTGSRIGVVLLANSHPPLAAYAQAMLATHPAGRPGSDDFVVVLASGDSGTAEIVVGEGLKPEIDAVARQRIVSEILVPKLSARKSYEALDAATDELIRRIEKPGLFALGAGERHHEPAHQHASRWPSLPFRLDGLPLVALLLSAALAAIIGMLAASFAETLPRFVRALIGGILAGLALWKLMGLGTLESKAEAIGAWAMVVGAVIAFFAKPHWLDVFGGDGGSSRRGGGGGSRSSSGRSSGGRSGGGGASKRW